MFRLSLTTRTTMNTNPTANAAIITIVVTEIYTTFVERLRFTSIPVKPFKASAPWKDFEPLNDNPGIEAVNLVLVSA